MKKKLTKKNVKCNEEEFNEKLTTIKKINPCNLNSNEPFALILKRDYRTYKKQEALLIKNIKIFDIKLSNYFCVILDEFGQVFVMSCHPDKSCGINSKFFCDNEYNEDYNDKDCNEKKENEFQLLNFTKEDPIKKIFAKFSLIFILLSKKGNVYLFGTYEKYKNYLNENNKIKDELLNGEKIIDATCGDSHILLLTESGKI
ncbi:hypothetical protein ABK040_000787 [Willaertia magna]